MNINTLTLADLAAPVANAIVGGPFGSNLVSKDYVPTGVPVIRGQNMGNKWVTGNFVFVSPEKASQLAANKARPGDLVFTQRGTLGQVSIVPAGSYSEYVVSQSQMKITPDPNKADVNFLYYLFKTEEQQKYILNAAIQTGVPHTNLGILRKTPVSLPSVSTQRQIAVVLSAFDDRIDLFHETNVTLEAIAQALFRSWFVDFDPVREKAEGREPEGLDAEVSGLFPSSFEESQLGPMPGGWKVSTLVEHIRAERGLSYKGAGLCSAEEGRPMHNLNSVYEGGGYKYPGIKFYKGDFKDRHIVRAGDIIVTNTEQGHEHRLIGFPAVVPEAYDNGIFSHHLYRLTIRSESPLTRQVLYYLLMSPNVREQVIGCANGSTVNMLKIHGMEIPRFVCPPATIARAFEDLTLPLRKQIELNVARAQALMTVRDVLLPKLISGRIRLTEAEALIREAA